MLYVLRKRVCAGTDGFFHRVKFVLCSLSKCHVVLLYITVTNSSTQVQIVSSSCNAWPNPCLYTLVCAFRHSYSKHMPAARCTHNERLPKL